MPPRFVAGFVSSPIDAHRPVDDRGRGITGAIIGGGAASRFAGRPKGLERVGGVRIIDRVASVLRTHSDALLIAAGDSDASRWRIDASTAPDVLAIKASVTGIHAALAAAGRDVIAVAWDMPFVPSSLIARLRTELLTGASAVIPRVGGRPEPLCAAYSSRVIGDIEAAVARGIVKMSDILATLTEVAWLDETDMEMMGDPDTMFFNVNSPLDLERAEVIARSL